MASTQSLPTVKPKDMSKSHPGLAGRPRLSKGTLRQRALAYAATGNVKDAAAIAGVCRERIYDALRLEDPDFPTVKKMAGKACYSTASALIQAGASRINELTPLQTFIASGIMLQRGQEQVDGLPSASVSISIASVTQALAALNQAGPTQPVAINSDNTNSTSIIEVDTKPVV